MRIAIIAAPWVPVPPPGYGGTEAVLDILARGLVTAGHEVLLFATGDSTCPVPTQWVRPVAFGTGTPTTAVELHQVVHAYQAVREWGADIVHDHTLLGPVYARGYAVPVVTTNHGPFSDEVRDVYRSLGDTVAIVALSRRQAATAVGVTIAGVIHHGIEVDRFPVGTGGGGYALFLGRMSPDKGVHVAARVARAAGVPLRIAAKMQEPAEHAYFAEEVAPLLGDGVEHVGEVGSAEKLALLADARCLLNPIAWDEPFGMVMIEALACGMPVVATARGSAPELVTDGVTGFVRASEPELVDALQRVGDLDRARCRQEAAERFSAERFVREHVALYERVLSTRQPRRVA